MHTPTEWAVDGFCLTSIIVKKEDGSGYRKILDCDTGEDHVNFEEALANARFIVRAVNAHEDLIKACKVAINMACDLSEAVNGKVTGTFKKDFDFIRQAITKAEGKLIHGIRL